MYINLRKYDSDVAAAVADTTLPVPDATKMAANNIINNYFSYLKHT